MARAAYAKTLRDRQAAFVILRLYSDSELAII
jgi:hypothetical protein